MEEILQDSDPELNEITDFQVYFDNSDSDTDSTNNVGSVEQRRKFQILFRWSSFYCSDISLLHLHYN